MPINGLRNNLKRDLKLFLCLAVTILFGFMPAYAAGVVDILVTILSFFITIIGKCIVYVLEMVANLFLGAMSVDIDYLIGKGFLKGFEFFSDGIRLVATGIAIMIFIWQLFVVLWGPLIGAQQKQSIMAIVGRGLIFIPLTYFIQPLALIALKQFQAVYKEFLSVYLIDEEHIFRVRTITSYFDPDNFANNFDISAGSGALSFFLESQIQDALGVLIACVMIIVITWQFVKLLLEMAQRFVVMLFYVYLSPLAAACGVGPNSMQISKSALTLFLSSGVLWILNVWSVSICLSLFAAIERAIGGASDLFIWSLITYGALKIAQQLDDIFNAVGATNVRLSGSLLDDIVSVTKLSGMASGMYSSFQKGLDKFAENGWGAGKDPTRPVEPGGAASRIPASGVAAAGVAGAAGAGAKREPVQVGTPASVKSVQAGLAKAANGMQPPTQKTTPSGETPRSYPGQMASAVRNVASQTAVGRAVQGFKKTSDNISTRINAGVAEAHAAADNKAVNRLNGALGQDNASDRAQAMAQLAKQHPETFNNQAAKDYLGENMGLGENQKVAGMSVDKNGQLSAMVATSNADGSVSLNKVDGINDMQFGENAPHAAPGNPVQDSGSAGGAGGANGAFAAGNQSGVRVNYTDNDQNVRSATVTRDEGSGTFENGKPVARFGVYDDAGGRVTVTVPASMSEQEVGSLVANTASAETREKFANGGGNDLQLMGSHARLNMDEEGPRTLQVDGNTVSAAGMPTQEAAQISYSDHSGNVRAANVVRDAGSETMVGGNEMASFTMKSADGSTSATVSAPANMSASEVASVVSNTATPEVRERFEQGGGNVSHIADAGSKFDIDDGANRSVSNVSIPAQEATQISYSDHDGNAHTANVMREHGSETMVGGNEMANFTVRANDGSASTTVTAPASMSESEVASVVSNTATSEVRERFEQGGGSMSHVSETASKLDIDNSSERSVNTVNMPSSGFGTDGNDSFGGHNSTTTDHVDGSRWTPEYHAQVTESPVAQGQSDVSFVYPQIQESGTAVPTAGYAKFEGMDPNGQAQYSYGMNNEVKGTVTLDKNITAEELSAMLMQKDGGGNPAVQEMRKNLGFTKEYTKGEADAVRDVMQKAKRSKKGVMTSEDAPIKPEK